MIKTGTANVAIEVIKVDKPLTNVVKKSDPRYIIQVASSQNEERVRTLSQNLGQSLSVQSFIDSDNGSHRAVLGPFTDYTLTQETLERVKSLGYETAFIKKYQVAQ